MTPPTERVTKKEQKWLEQVAKEHLPAEYLSENGGVMAALAEVCDKTKEACWGTVHCADCAAAIRNLEITGD